MSLKCFSGIAPLFPYVVAGRSLNTAYRRRVLELLKG